MRELPKSDANPTSRRWTILVCAGFGLAVSLISEGAYFAQFHAVFGMAFNFYRAVSLLGDVGMFCAVMINAAFTGNFHGGPSDSVFLLLATPINTALFGGLAYRCYTLLVRRRP